MCETKIILPYELPVNIYIQVVYKLTCTVLYSVYCTAVLYMYSTVVCVVYDVDSHFIANMIPIERTLAL